MTKTRYVVEFTPLAAVEAACRGRGMKAGDGTSFWDWVEPGACAMRLEFSTFKRAVAEANARAAADAFGAPRVERQRLLPNHDDRGRRVTGSSWEGDALWECHGDAHVHETAPHVLLDAA
jgi:hypothetical protein